MVIELVEMTISTKYSGFDKLNHRFSYLLDSLVFLIMVRPCGQFLSVSEIISLSSAHPLCGSLLQANLAARKCSSDIR
jgi:hypothetical protein